MKQETSGISATELTEPQLTEVTGGGMSAEELQALADATVQKGRAHIEQASEQHGTSVGSRVVSVAVGNTTDFAAFLGGGAIANVIAPRKKGN